MTCDKNASVEMEVLRLVIVLLFAVQVPPCHSLQGLTCINDFIKNITCVWNSSGTHPGAHCVLQGVLRLGKAYEGSCVLKPMGGQSTLRSCQLEFEKEGFRRRVRVAINVTCGKYTVDHHDYEPRLHVKMHPPGKPVITKSNVSWSLGSPHSRMIFNYYFQLQYKESEQPWQNVVPRNLTDKLMSVELPEDKLEQGRLYEARVRVKPTEQQSSLKGVWSSWSPIASWRSEVGRSSEKPGSFPGPGPGLLVTLVLVTAAVSLLVLITCTHHRAGWVHKLKLPHVPNPSTYFHSLNYVHGGNFQKWLGPMLAPESFHVPQCFEDISAVELKPKDIATPLYSKRASDPKEQWDSSPRSSSNVEVCPVYTGYRSGVEHSGDKGGGKEVELKYAPHRVSCSYEKLGWESSQPDPSSRGQEEEEEEEEEDEEGEEEEEEEEGEIEDGPKEMDGLPPLTILPFSLSGPVTPSNIPLPLVLPFPFLDFDTVLGSSNASGPLMGALSKCPFAEIEPSSGGYLSVQSARCNNS